MANVTNLIEEMQSDSNKEETTTDNITSTVNNTTTGSGILGNFNANRYESIYSMLSQQQ